MDTGRIRVLAVASGGGHWVQLMRLAHAFSDGEVEFVTTNAGYRSEVPGVMHVVTDASMWEKLKLVRMFAEIGWIVVTRRPNVVVSTGAAPGFAAIVFGKFFRARTIWIDSVANSEELSASGRVAGRFADVWLTQWPHLARPEGPHYWGAVL
jgi:UDP-N-acetylglucosamine:LPS N-acetylglucosamine transferase